MSCERRQNAVATASAGSGVAISSSKAANITGAMMGRMGQMASRIGAGMKKAPEMVDAGIEGVARRTMAPVAAGVLKSGRPSSDAGASGPATPGESSPPAQGPGVDKKDVVVLTRAAASMYTRNFPPGIRPAVNKMVSRGGRTLAKSTQARAQLGVKAGQLALKAMPVTRAAGRAVKTADRVSSAAGNIIGAKSVTEEAGQVMQEKRKLLFFKSKTPVTLWKSKLTDTLNRQDVPGTGRFTGQNVAVSEGVMFKTEGKTWHRGTTVVKTNQGQRTMTHLRSMNVPANHYYFNRSIPDEAAVGIASGRTKPQDVSGFAGQVSATENLCPVLASTKQALIKAQVYYGKE